MDRDILSFFWKYIKPYKWYYLIMLLGPLGGSLYPFVYHYAIKWMLDIMDNPANNTFASLQYPIILFVSSQFIHDILWRISNWAEWSSEPYVRRSMLMDTYNQVQHHSFRFFQNNFSGSISSKLKGLLDGYDKFWAEMHHGLSLQATTVLFNVAALSLVSVNLCIYIIIWGAVYTFTVYHLSKGLNKLAFAETECRHSVIGAVSDRVNNIFSLFSFATRKKELARLEKRLTDEFIPKQVAMYKYDFILQLVFGVLYIALFIFILFYVVHLRTLGEITIGDFTFTFGLTIVIVEALYRTTVSLQEFARAMGDMKSSLTVLNSSNETIDLPGSQDLMIKSAEVKFDKVSFAYDDSLVLKDFSLQIKSGEKIGIVGSSGAGKSTIVNLLMRYFDVSSGKIMIDGKEIAKVTQDSLRENIGLIPQDTMLFHRSIFENINYGKLTATEGEVLEASKKAHIHDFIMGLPEGYQTMVGERGLKLSGGQRQRIAIARAILKDAPILILDEATSALDSQTEKLIQDSINLLIEDNTKTVIAIAHRLSTLKHMDRIVVLDKGKIIEQGTHNELILKDSLYKKLWELQELK